MQYPNLKKLFPLSFKFSKSGKGVLLGILLYFAVAVVLKLALNAVQLAISPLVAIVIAIPCFILGFVPIVLGIVLMFVMPSIGTAVFYIGLLPFAVCMWAFGVVFVIAEFFITAYVITGVVVLFLSYGGAFDNAKADVSKEQGTENTESDTAPDELV